MESTAEALSPPLLAQYVYRPAVASISIVIPALNAAGLLHQQLAALMPQAADAEVIVADNGSEDRTAEVAQAHGARVVNASDRRGRHFACNAGAAHAKGDALVFIDADDEVAPGFVQAMKAALTEHEFVAGRLAPWPGFETDAVVQQDGLLTLGWRPFVSGAAMGVTRAAFNEIGGFSEDMTFSEDVDLSWRLIAAGYEPFYAHDAIVKYRTRSRPLEMFRQHRNYGRGQVRLYRRWRHDGMPRRPWRRVVSEVTGVLKSLPFLQDRSVRVRWSKRVGRLVGHFIESTRSGVIYL